MLSQEAFQAVREQIKIALRKPDPQKYIEGIISKLSNIHIADILCHIANIIETRIEAFDGDAIADSVIFEDAIRYIAKYLKTKGVILTQKIYWDGKESTLGEYIASKSHKFSPELAQSISKGEIILVPPKPPTIAALDIISAADNIEADMGHGPVNQQDMDITGAAAD